MDGMSLKCKVMMAVNIDCIYVTHSCCRTFVAAKKWGVGAGDGDDV